MNVGIVASGKSGTGKTTTMWRRPDAFMRLGLATTFTEKRRMEAAGCTVRVFLTVLEIGGGVSVMHGLLCSSR